MKWRLTVTVMTLVAFLHDLCGKSVTITALISRSCSLLSHASGQDTSASRLFTIVSFRHSLLMNAHGVTMKNET